MALILTEREYRAVAGWNQAISSSRVVPGPKDRVRAPAA